jgi:flagellar motor switch protein FliG
LADLDAKSLALVMHHSDPKLLLLSMAGADRGLFDRMKRELPASELRQLQRRLAEIRPWRLSDLDAAQQVVAQTADRLALRGLIPLPPAQRLEAGV